MKSTGMKSIVVLVVVIVAIIALGAGVEVLVGNAASESDAEKALRVQGFSQIHLLKRHVWFVSTQGCGRDDVARFDFSAVNPIKQHVDVSVCAGWLFKGDTVRYP